MATIVNGMAGAMTRVWKDVSSPSFWRRAWAQFNGLSPEYKLAAGAAGVLCTLILLFFLCCRRRASTVVTLEEELTQKLVAIDDLYVYMSRNASDGPSVHCSVPSSRVESRVAVVFWHGSESHGAQQTRVSSRGLCCLRWGRPASGPLA